MGERSWKGEKNEDYLCVGGFVCIDRLRKDYL